jgi:hypothetical protein
VAGFGRVMVASVAPLFTMIHWSVAPMVASAVYVTGAVGAGATVYQLNVPLPFVASTCPSVPSAEGRV